MVKPKTIFDDTSVQSNVPLEDEDEDKAIVAWIYRGEDTTATKTQKYEITLEKYGQGLKIMKHLNYKGSDPIGKKKVWSIQLKLHLDILMKQ